MRLNINTQFKSTGRVRGWTVTSELDRTIKNVITFHPELIPALIAKIEKELAKENLREQELREQLDKSVKWRINRRKSYHEIKLNARYDRWVHKTSCLERALKDLRSI